MTDSKQPNRWVRPAIQVAMILGIAAGAWLLEIWLESTKEEASSKAPNVLAPLVIAHTVQLKNETVHVPSQGTVAPRTEIQLVPQVSGTVTTVAASLVAGGFFHAGDTLLTVDDRDYRNLAVQRAAAVARARTAVAQEEAQAASSIREWKELHGDDPIPALVAREPQLAQVRAELASAEAQLAQARLDVERCTWTAPFTGRVRARSVDVGQYVVAGQSVGTLYAVEWFEVTLPVPDDELAFLDVPGVRDVAEQPPVRLTARLAGQPYTFAARLDRTGGAVDERTRQVPLIARLDDPYGLHDRGGPPDRPTPTGQGTDGRPLLEVGMFVQADIRGRTFEGIARIPGALRDGDKVLVITADSTLSFRPVKILRKERHDVLVRSGLEPGERICLTDLEATEGMKVRVEGDDVPEEGGPTDAGIGPADGDPEVLENGTPPGDTTGGGGGDGSAATGGGGKEPAANQGTVGGGQGL